MTNQLTKKMTTNATELTDDQVETIIRQARKGDKHAQFFYQRLHKTDLCREQFLRVENKIGGTY